VNASAPERAVGLETQGPVNGPLDQDGAQLGRLEVPVVRQHAVARGHRERGVLVRAIGVVHRDWVVKCDGVVVGHFLGREGPRVKRGFIQIALEEIADVAAAVPGSQRERIDEVGRSIRAVAALPHSKVLPDRVDVQRDEIFQAC
jgi:hypothetical protein